MYFRLKMAEGQGSSMFQADQERYRQVQIIEEEITEEKKSSPCEICVRERPYVLEPLSVRVDPSMRERWYEVCRYSIKCVDVFLSPECEMYVCENCLPRHESHEGMNVGRKESEREEKERNESERMEDQSSSERMTNKGKGLGKKTKRMRLEEEREEEGEKSERMEEEKERQKSESERMEGENERKLRLLLDGLMKESETERIEKFDKRHVSIYDRVHVKHKLDERNCWISGLCGLENQRWVACDRRNLCIKIFTLGSNVLQRYIRFVCGPCDVTEIPVNQNSSEPNLASGSSSGVSATDRADPAKQCLIAVTLPWERQIMFIDLSKKPAFIHKIIRTEGRCYSIQFYDDKIFTVCNEGLLDFPSSVYIYSTDGDSLNKFDIGIYDYTPGPYLAVVSGRVYLTDRDNNKVQCRNVGGHVLSKLTIEGSWPEGTSVDPDNNVYVCARNHGKVYKLDADLTRYESVLDQTADYIARPEALCYYRDKLFIGHEWSSPLDNFVTVVRLL